MHAHKKKPRQRNRPRNKANRFKDEIGGDDSGKNEIENNTDSDIAIAKCTDDILVNELKFSDPVLQENDDDAIRLIQKLLRSKLLKKSEENSNNNNPRNDNQTLPHSTDNKTKSKESTAGSLADRKVLVATLQKKMQSSLANDSTDLPITLLDNLKKLFDQKPISDVETSDEEEEYIEYIYKPRKYFLTSLCNFCKSNLCGQTLVPCSRCRLTYYCSRSHMKSDEQHRELCYSLQQVAEESDGHIFYKCGVFTAEQFRSYRIVIIRKVEAVIKRTLTAPEQEVILFPRICCDAKCREYRFDKLLDCNVCGQIAFCKDKPDHFNNKIHELWCDSYKLFKDMIIFQEQFGRLDPSLPTKVLKEMPIFCSNTKQILNKLLFDIQDACEYAALTRISTGPLTAWYALKLCDQLRNSDTIVIHLIGAEFEFEVDILHKWELFFLHLSPLVKELSVVFVGPELNPRNISFEQLQKTKSCRTCRKNQRSVKYYFENRIYHEYYKSKSFIKPDLVCFFNPGLYRSTGFHMEDTWPETIHAITEIKCTVLVTSYTAYEAPLDMARLVQECNRRLNVVLPPTKNPFASEKPERNFISDDEAPLMFKNLYCFVVE